ncbi:MAG: MBL fold metallo-hydrolase [Zavarzinella sp.]
MAEQDRTFVFLGTGTSTGVPVVGCDCTVCRSKNPKNQRYRASGLIQTPRGNILIDTGPEMRLQLLREEIRRVDAVLYTHYHVDHLYGMDDLRVLGKYHTEPIPVYCTEEVEAVIRRVFAYMFEWDHANRNYLPRLEFRTIDEQPFEVLGEKITPIPLQHHTFHVFGYRVGNMAYCTDVNEFPSRSWPLLEDLDVFIIDTLRYKSHPAHMGLNESLEVIERLNPGQAYLTHMSHELDYDAVNASLPGGVAMAYDGLRFRF